MEQITVNLQSVRKKQLLAVSLILYPVVVDLILVVCNLIGVKSELPLMINMGYLCSAAICWLAAVLLLTRITVNSATRNTVKWVGIWLFLVSLYSMAVKAYVMTHEMEPIVYSLYFASFVIVKELPFLYLFGVIVRNNPECGQARWAITTNVLVVYVLATALSQFSFFIAEQFRFLFIQLVDLFRCLAVVITYYKLFTSDVFNGKLDNQPAPKGAYRFWNKYLTWYVITSLVVPIILVILS